MSDTERIEEVEVVISREGPPGMGGNSAALLREFADLRRRLDSNRLLLGALLAIGAVCLALLLVIAGRGM